jgi:hypothetical protein
MVDLEFRPAWIQPIELLFIEIAIKNATVRNIAWAKGMCL